MVNIINAFFTWTATILTTFLNIELIDGFKFIHIILFLGIVRILIGFIKSRKGSKSDKSE